MEKMNLHTPNLADENFTRLAALFPNAVTETTDADGKVIRAIDKDVLMQEINCYVVDGKEERYQFTWPDKKKSVLLANAPSTNTLRPCAEESVGRGGEAGGFDSENLYIEGDNLEVLKLLKETYLHKIKMIYIDPPYNTGNDFVYDDDFTADSEEYKSMSGDFDTQGNRLVKNLDSNGRFHTDWLNMIYPRLRLAKDLLTDDGVIFISIDDNEVENLKKVCDEVFGESNFCGEIIVKSNPRGSMSSAEIANLHEYLLLYTKNRLQANIIGHKLTDEMTEEYNLSDEKGNYRLLGLRMRGGFWRRSERPKLFFPIYVNPNTFEISLEKKSGFSEEALPIQPTTGEDGTWRWSKEKIKQDAHLLVGKQINRNGEICWDIYQKDYLNKYEERRTKARSIWDESEINYQNGTNEIKQLLGNSSFFDYSKPPFLIKRAMEMLDWGFSSNQNSEPKSQNSELLNSQIILDFFSGSATTAHAVMQLNAEDGGNRKFIMVQLPEKCDESSEAFKAGYKNICEIGKERIRRAGKLIIENGKLKDKSSSQNDLFSKDNSQSSTVNSQLDIGFRVLKLDTSNMQEVYYTPQATDQQMLSGMVDNIKPDRSDMDLLFQVMLEYGISLSAKIECKKIDGKDVYFVEDTFLAACFDKAVNDAVVTEIAKAKPQYVALRDMDSDATLTNFEQIFNAISPETVCKVV